MRGISITLLLVAFVAAVLAQQPGQRLISFNETHTEWMSEAQIQDLQNKKVKFMDITNHQNEVASNVHPDPLPVEPMHKLYIEEIIPLLSKDTLESTLTTLSANPTRYYTSSTGVSAAKWIASQFTSYANHNTAITVELFQHSFAQPSVIATIPGNGPNKDQIVVIGGHEDSTSYKSNAAPGADDDGSGTVSVLEVFRVLAQVGYMPDRTVKFMTYAAEEVGLLGSQDIVDSFVKDSANVYAVLQLDMTGYGGIDPVGVVSDYVDANLTQFVKILVDTYSELDWTDTECGYACSDHASWTKAGYRSAFPFETSFEDMNPYIHTPDDTIDKISLDRILEFCKIGLSFVVELAGVAMMK